MRSLACAGNVAAKTQPMTMNRGKRRARPQSRLSFCSLAVRAEKTFIGNGFRNLFMFYRCFREGKISKAGAYYDYG